MKQLGQRLRVCTAAVEAHLIAGEFDEAGRAWVQLEGLLAEALALRSLGDDFGMAANALQLSLSNESVMGVRLERWRVWRDVAEQVFETIPRDGDTALELIDRLELADWNPEPPGFAAFSEFLLCDIVSSRI